MLHVFRRGLTSEPPVYVEPPEPSCESEASVPVAATFVSVVCYTVSAGADG